MKNGIKKNLILMIATLVCASPAVYSQDIVFSGGSGDVTWFYDSENNSWDTVFRQKNDTVATGLTDPYGTPPGGVGGSADDFNFETLTTVVTNPTIRTLNGINYFTIGDNNNVAPGRPDLGIRTRLREGSGDPQFGTPDNAVGFQLNLDWDASDVPDGAEFAFWRTGLTGPVVRYETAAGNFDSEWPGWGHSHWFWGFSQVGNYDLAFNFQGVGGTYGDNSSMGTVRLAFSVVPEPSSLFILAGTGFAFLARRRRKPLL